MGNSSSRNRCSAAVGKLLLKSRNPWLYASSSQCTDLARGSSHQHRQALRSKLLTQEEINSLLVHHGSTAQTTVRLKGGDPSIFGRAGEEIQALQEAGISHEIVPGITSALAGAAAAGISLTELPPDLAL